jgi:hypothetical protein
MKRRLFNLAAAVSLGMMLATAVLWVRSYCVWDLWAAQWPEDAIPRRYGSIESWRGKLVLSYIPVGAQVRFDDWGWTGGGFAFFRTTINLWDFHSSHAPEPPWFHNGPALQGYQVGVPLWFVVAASATLPAAALWKRAARRQHKLGCCSSCGYDLRATPERCPECGTAVAPKPAEAAA